MDEACLSINFKQHVVVFNWVYLLFRVEPVVKPTNTHLYSVITSLCSFNIV